MIFDTLAAMADYNNNNKFDTSATQEECKTVLENKNSAGLLTLADGTVRVDSLAAKTVSDADKYAIFAYAILNKTPRSSIEADLAAYL